MGKARPPPCVSSPLVTEAPLHRPGITVLQSVNTVDCLPRSALKSPVMHFLRNTALFIYRVFVCAKCHGDFRNWIILEFLMLPPWLVKLVASGSPGLTDIDGPASVTSGRSWREARLGLWLVQSWNTRLWLAPAPFLTWRRRWGIKHASGLATSSVSLRLFRS